MKNDFDNIGSLASLRHACQEHINGTTNPIDLQRAIVLSEPDLSAVHQNKIREFLIGKEGEIELAIYTMDSDVAFGVSKRIADEIIDWLSINYK